MIRPTMRIGIILAALLLELSCGLPQLLYLAPPVFVSVDGVGATFVFSHDDANDSDNFLGYEIYYKFYAPATSELTFGGDAAAIEASAPGNVVTVLQGRGYRRVYPAIAAIKPLLSIAVPDKATLFNVTVALPNKRYAAGDPAASAAWLAYPPLNLIRDQSFAQAYGDETFYSIDINSQPPGDEDDDLPGSLPAPPGQVDAGVVVLAYGIDYENGTFAEVYSEPLVITAPTDLIPMWYE